MDKDFNLPGLFRALAYEARQQRKLKTVLVFPEVDKDEVIDALTHTRFVQQFSPIKKATIPMNFHIDEIFVEILASEHLETGVVVMEFNQ